MVRLLCIRANFSSRPLPTFHLVKRHEVCPRLFSVRHEGIVSQNVVRFQAMRKVSSLWWCSFTKFAVIVYEKQLICCTKHAGMQTELGKEGEREFMWLGRVQWSCTVKFDFMEMGAKFAGRLHSDLRENQHGNVAHWINIRGDNCCTFWNLSCLPPWCLGLQIEKKSECCLAPSLPDVYRKTQFVLRMWEDGWG